MVYATIKLPLHGGHAPSYLIERMVKLSGAIAKVIVNEYGEHEFLRRLSDPLWFQAFGCVLGFDWHSSGVTTVVTGVLKQSLTFEDHGISIAGGKGKKSTQTKNEIPVLAEKYYNLSDSKIDRLLYVSKMTAKVDNAAVQDGYTLYHHAIFFDKNGDWSVVQQGMNAKDMTARRYHWLSDFAKAFISEPHSGIISNYKNLSALNMVSVDSNENQKVSLELATDNTQNLKSSVSKLILLKNDLLRINRTLDNWMPKNSTNTSGNFFEDYSENEHYEMPGKLDWNLFRKIYDIQPRNYEQLLSINGFGPAAVRALSLIGEIIYGTKASWQDPVKYNFAHGGKDGVPYPVARKTYDKSISYLSGAIEGAEIETQERLHALKSLAEFSKRLFPNSGQ